MALSLVDSKIETVSPTCVGWMLLRGISRVAADGDEAHVTSSSVRGVARGRRESSGSCVAGPVSAAGATAGRCRGAGQEGPHAQEAMLLFASGRVTRCSSGERLTAAGSSARPVVEHLGPQARIWRAWTSRAGERGLTTPARTCRDLVRETGPQFRPDRDDVAHDGAWGHLRCADAACATPCDGSDAVRREMKHHLRCIALRRRLQQRIVEGADGVRRRARAPWRELYEIADELDLASALRRRRDVRRRRWVVEVGSISSAYAAPRLGYRAQWVPVAPPLSRGVATASCGTAGARSASTERPRT